MARGAQRNHQLGARNAGHPVMDNDKVPVLLAGAIKAALAGPAVACQHLFPIAPEIFLVVMLACERAGGHASRDDIERAAGAQTTGLGAGRTARPQDSQYRYS